MTRTDPNTAHHDVYSNADRCLLVVRLGDWYQERNRWKAFQLASSTGQGHLSGSCWQTLTPAVHWWLSLLNCWKHAMLKGLVLHCHCVSTTSDSQLNPKRPKWCIIQDQGKPMEILQWQWMDRNLQPWTSWTKIHAPGSLAVCKDRQGQLCLQPTAVVGVRTQWGEPTAKSSRTQVRPGPHIPKASKEVEPFPPQLPSQAA